MSGIMLAVVSDSSWDSVITVGAPQLVRPVADWPGTTDRSCIARICETEIVAISIKKRSRTGFFQLIRNVSNRCMRGSNATCFLLVSNLVSRPSGAIGLTRANLSVYSPNENQTLCCERSLRQETSILVGRSYVSPNLSVELLVQVPNPHATLHKANEER